jgi:hypothetical protein
MAQTYNTVIDQGADWFLNVTWEDINGDPIDVTGYTAALQMRTSPLARTYVLSLSSPSDGITVTGASGLFAIHATAEQTADIAPGRYSYDLEIDSGTIITRLIQGTIEVSANTTRE